jgi:hypothetical protein
VKFNLVRTEHNMYVIETTRRTAFAVLVSKGISTQSRGNGRPSFTLTANSLDSSGELKAQILLKDELLALQNIPGIKCFRV